jgi:hypothetical protein
VCVKENWKASFLSVPRRRWSSPVFGDVANHFDRWLGYRWLVSTDVRLVFACCGLIFDSAFPVVPDIAQDNLDHAGDRDGK